MTRALVLHALVVGALVAVPVAAVPVVAFPVMAQAADKAPAFPAFDLDGYCQSQAKYSYAATLGDSTFDGVLLTCKDREGDAKASAAAVWPRVAPKVAAECIGLADGKYSWLARCLDQGSAGRSLTRR